MVALSDEYSRQVSGRSQDFCQDMLNESASYLTQGQTVLINSIFMTIYTLDYNIDALQSNLNSLEAVAYNLPASEQPVVLSAISVARSSSYYWDANIDAWAQALDPSLHLALPRVNGKILWGAVAGMDVSAAVVVGGGSALLIGIPVLGWATWGIGTAAAAVIVSGATAIISYLTVNTTGTNRPIPQI